MDSTKRLVERAKKREQERYEKQVGFIEDYFVAAIFSPLNPFSYHQTYINFLNMYRAACDAFNKYSKYLEAKEEVFAEQFAPIESAPLSDAHLQG